MADMLRVLGIGIQTARLTEATVLTYMDFVESIDFEDDVKYDTPEYKRYTRWVESSATAQTRMAKVHFGGRVDSTEIGHVLASALGAPVTTGSSGAFTHVFTGGTSNSPYVTIQILDGIKAGAYDVAYRGKDFRVAEFHWTLDATGSMKFTAVAVGPALTERRDATIVPVLSPPADNSPFAPWQTVIQFGAFGGAVAGICVDSAKVDLTNAFDPHFCTPTVAPTATTPAGLAPNRFLEGVAKGAYDVMVEYDGSGTMPYDLYKSDTPTQYDIKASDPKTVLAAGVFPSIQFSLPKAKGTKGKLDLTKVNVPQSVSGVLLNSGVTGLVITLVNAKTSYAGS